MKNTLSKKQQWVLSYLKTTAPLAYVDMLDEAFVSLYVSEFEDTCAFVGLGAPKCKELSKLLSSMYKAGLLERWVHGVRSGLGQDGKFPKWVYSYRVTK